MNKFRNLGLLAVVTLVCIALSQLSVVSAGFALLMLALFQLLQFAMARSIGVCFTTVLTPEQIKEFEQILTGFKGYDSMFKELAGLVKMEGGIEALKKMPELLKGEQKRNDDLQGEVKKLQKRLANAGTSTGVRWVGNVPFVSDDCAKALTSVFVMECARMKDGQALEALVRDPGTRVRVAGLAAETLGFADVKTALATTEIPVPTVYVPQVIELVYRYGQARQYATVFPLGSGSVKLPRLKAGEDDFGYLGVGTSGMSQAIGEKRVAAELVTFTANKAGGIVRIPTELEEDTFIPIGQFLARYIARQLAKLEDKTLFLADGTAAYANQTGIAKFCQTNTDFLLSMDAGKTKPSDVTLDNFRNLRAKVSAAILAGGFDAAYYMSPTFEPLLRGFNKYPNFVVFENINGKATLDGWPVRWIGVSQAYSTAAAAAKPLAFFGALPYWYLGERGQVRMEVSREVFFATDELAMRALERIDVEAMATDAMATLQTAAE